MDRDAERTTDSPIGQRHAFTVTVGDLERQLGIASGIGYTSHDATTLFARDSRPRLDDAAHPSGAYFHAGSGDQVGPSLLSWSRVDVRPLPRA